MLFSSNKINSFALQKDNYISVSLDISLPEIKKYTKKSVKSKIKIDNAVAMPDQEVDVENLFDSVWTKNINTKKRKKKKTDNKRLQEIQKRVKTIKDNSVKDISKIVENIDKISSESENSSASTSNEVNEYLAKIQAIVYKHFYPPSNSEGHTVKAVIELSALGKVIDFRILTYSSNAALNDECNKIRERLLGVLFPINPQNKSSTTIVNITSDKN